MKKVSVIIPYYNKAEYVYDAVKSVCDSSYPNIEIIVINDGSTDVSPKILEEILEDFDNVKIIHQENSGVCAARNNGIKIASGEYILPLDADDKIAPEYIEKAVEILDTKQEVGIVYCDAEWIGARTGKLIQKAPTIPNMLVQNRIFVTSMFRKSDYEKVGGFNSNMEMGCEDWNFWLDLVENGAEIYKIPEVLFFYRKHENTRTTSALKFAHYLKIRKTIIKNHKELYQKCVLSVILPLTFSICKNALYNTKIGICGALYRFKKLLRRMYYKTAINYFNLYPNIKHINKKTLQREIDEFLQAKDFDKREVIQNLVISLTSIPERMYDIHYTIYSLITQSVQPEKIVLYLGKDQFKNGEKDIPEQVLRFKDYGVEFHFVEDVRSFTKLIPALEEYPDKTIVTADDDIFYEKDWLKLLVETHKNYPDDIIVHKHLNVINAPYCNWSDKQEAQASYKNFLMGVGGVLYPSKSLYKDVTKRSLFLRLCPHNDDVWFWAMAVLNEEKIRICDGAISKLTLVNVERELNLNNEMTLYKGNRESRTDTEFLRILEYYNIGDILGE